ncbi:MAG: AAA family ATPase [Candidatus Lokiarchaeota archaeon]|nr:AAA family ATPase [Candidatus Lokiarchaeota archaeon]
MVKVIIITGTPGTGKTTLAKLICETTNSKLFEINSIVIQNEFFEDWDEERNVPIVNNEKIFLFFQDYLKSSSDEKIIIVEGHYFEFIPEGLIDKIVILRSYPSILKQRLINKNFNDLKINENVQAEILGSIMGIVIDKYSKISLLQVDTSDMSIENSKNLILNFIEDRIPSTNQSEYIDWLPILEEKKELDSYF